MKRVEPTSFENLMPKLGWSVLFLMLAPVLLLDLSLVLDSLQSRVQSVLERKGEVGHYCDLMPGVCRHNPNSPDWRVDPEHFGRLQALIDIRENRMERFEYGLIVPGYYQALAKRLAANGVELRGGGCVVGTPKFLRDMAYNNTVWEHLPIDAQLALSMSASELVSE